MTKGDLFKQCKVHDPLLNQKATRKAILDQLAALRESVKREDVVVLFFADTFEEILGFSIFLDSIGMATSVGRLRRDNALENAVKYLLVSHNTKMGAAKGAVLMAEYLLQKGYV